MENLLQETEDLLKNFEAGIHSKVKAFKNLPEAFKEYLPEAKTRAIKENEKRILNETSQYLQFTEDKIKPHLTGIEEKISRLIYPKRSSGISAEQQAGEQQFLSALSLINSKNQNLIKSELKKSLSNPNRNDFSFSAFEIIRNSDDIKPEFKDEIGTLFNSHSLAKDYILSEKVKNNLNEIQSQIGYYKRAVSSGRLDGNYKINRNLREAK